MFILFWIAFTHSEQLGKGFIQVGSLNNLQFSEASCLVLVPDPSIMQLGLDRTLITGFHVNTKWDPNTIDSDQI